MLDEQTSAWAEIRNRLAAEKKNTILPEIDPNQVLTETEAVTELEIVDYPEESK